MTWKRKFLIFLLISRDDEWFATMVKFMDRVRQILSRRGGLRSRGWRTSRFVIGLELHRLADIKPNPDEWDGRIRMCMETRHDNLEGSIEKGNRKPEGLLPNHKPHLTNEYERVCFMLRRHSQRKV